MVRLKPGTPYLIRLRAGANEAALTVRLRSDLFPIGECTTLPPGDSADGITIAKSGTPQLAQCCSINATASGGG